MSVQYGLRDTGSSSDTLIGCGLRYPAGMSGSEIPEKERPRIGLCFDCRHARSVESDRGSAFIYCGLSVTDSDFPKYPHLPVIQCNGFTPKG